MKLIRYKALYNKQLKEGVGLVGKERRKCHAENTATAGGARSKHWVLTILHEYSYSWCDQE
jgi:hypothetical protein